MTVVDTYLVPDAPGLHGEWWVARYNDDDGQWTCRHKHETEEEAMGCARRFSASFSQRLPGILREEAGAILATQRSMRAEQAAIGWRPSPEDKLRLEAVDAANHQLTFSLLAIADRLEGKSA